MSLRKIRPDYKWVVLVVCFLMEFICLGFCSSNMGLFTVPVTDALHIDRLTYSYWSSIRYIVQVFVALYFGTLVNRFGVKRMVFVGLSALIGATTLRALATNVLHIYIPVRSTVLVSCFQAVQWPEPSCSGGSRKTSENIPAS